MGCRTRAWGDPTKVAPAGSAKRHFRPAGKIQDGESDIKANAFGFDEEKRVNAAVSRVAKFVRAQNCNCLEITQMATKSFLGIPYVSVVASQCCSCDKSCVDPNRGAMRESRGAGAALRGFGQNGSSLTLYVF